MVTDLQVLCTPADNLTCGAFVACLTVERTTTAAKNVTSSQDEHWTPSGRYISLKQQCNRQNKQKTALAP